MSVRSPWPLGAAIRSRASAALISTVSAAAIAVVINVWTASWTWPAGAGLATLLLTQALFEWSQARAADSVSSSPSRWTVEQHFADVSDSSITAARRPAPGGDAEVRQRLGSVSRSTIVGIDSTNTQ
ncbi:hypothetical protein PV682_38860 [Streptomyces niveiscabiei]|uniref:hypothetical protein n=1 Tax=Streptomyces niveiscabiei TaxID=164115 RepID=UPI0029BE9864|nr:hypothetical protein [Streptomyces niveiscabiei]MDX3387362.1 hypothetical protein [Streptomyces niveiscabiei]